MLSWSRRQRGLLTLSASVLVVASGSRVTLGQDQQPPPEAEQESEKLGERLLREAAAGGDEDPMETMLRLMDEAARHLEIEFDAGAETQAVQARIVEELDRAIKIAAAQSRRARSRTSDWTGEKRTRGRDRQQPGDQGATSTAENAGAAPESEAAVSGGAESASEPARGKLREVRRSWGLLPEREREEIIQGSEEQFLERYREWIERYYRALQEAPQ